MEKEKKENKWEDIGYYIGVNNIISVELKEAVEGSKIIKPKNGYWVKKSAIISNTTPKKETLSFEQFKKETPDIQSPFVGEEGIMYKAVYDKLTDRVQYFKNGRRNSTKITVKKAYDTYLFDNDKKMEKGGLIAPNGKQSNLTPEQYKLVRTPEFKAWFGDWENDPKNASKVVDENGEPLVCYHGTDYDFNTFEKDLNVRDYGYFGKGFYFTQIKKLAESYGSKVIDVFLNSKNTFIYNGKNESIELKFGQELGVIPKIDEDGDKIEEEYDFGNSHWFNERYAATLTLKIKKLGYDGVIVKEIDEIIVYNSNQIKLADGTNTTFDSTNPDIRFETGGEIESGMIVTFKDIYGDLHNGKVISKNNIKNAFDVVEISTQKEYLVSPSQIVS